MQIASNFWTDPLILTAVCKLTTKVLQLDAVKNNKLLLEKIVNNIKSCTHLLPYLGLQKYEELCKNTKKYHPEQKNGHDDIYVYMNHQDDPII